MARPRTVPVPVVRLRPDGVEEFRAVDFGAWNGLGLAGVALWMAAAVLVWRSAPWWAPVGLGLVGLLLLWLRTHVMRVVLVEGGVARFEVRVVGRPVRVRLLPAGTRCVFDVPDDDSQDYGMGTPRLELRAPGDVVILFAEHHTARLGEFAAELNARLPG
jgi:hypothetical protein